MNQNEIENVARDIVDSSREASDVFERLSELIEEVSDQMTRKALKGCAQAGRVLHICDEIISNANLA